MRRWVALDPGLVDVSLRRPMSPSDSSATGDNGFCVRPDIDILRCCGWWGRSLEEEDEEEFDPVRWRWLSGGPPSWLWLSTGNGMSDEVTKAKSRTIGGFLMVLSSIDRRQVHRIEKCGKGR